MKWLTDCSCPHSIKEEKGRLTITSHSPLTVYGGGERFNGPRLKGKYRNEVEEKFTHQGNVTYLPIPIFFISGLGVFLDTDYVFDIDVKENEVVFTGENLGEIFLSNASIKESLNSFMSFKGETTLPPKWVFGQWISANRWKNMNDVKEAIESSDKYGFDFSALVIEAWSDESTFYHFSEENNWDGFQNLVSDLKKNDRHILLWQCPVYKKLEEGRHEERHEKDLEKVMERSLEVLNPDKTPYVIPTGHWFSSSMIPDFTKSDTRNDWIDKRQYLIDMGVSGFKTDGGEFVLSDDVVFSDGRRGKEVKNIYPDLYSALYREHGSVTFSRAGYLESWKGGLYWAGDQMSTWSELKSVLSAGLSASVSGIFFWGFDIAGFSGPIPGRELYIRSYELSTFVPIMQWHSEPVGGQFSEIMKSQDAVNDRSPWNIDRVYGGGVIEICRKYSAIRSEIRWYLEKEAEYSVCHKEPIMRPMFYSFDGEESTDQFLLGRSILVAPIIEEGMNEREVIVPDGKWYSVNLKETIEGRRKIKLSLPIDEIGLFINEESSDYFLLKKILEGVING